MVERKYTIQEIEGMRQSIGWSYPPNVPYYAEARAAEIEDQLRTYMANGTEPKEVSEMARARISAFQQAEIAAAEYRRKCAENNPPQKQTFLQRLFARW